MSSDVVVSTGDNPSVIVDEACRHVDNRPMSTLLKPRSNRQIIGVSLPPDVARAFKEEAARRGISLRKLFEELWAAYKPPNASGEHARKSR